jgi:hypothetical protein
MSYLRSTLSTTIEILKGIAVKMNVNRSTVVSGTLSAELVELGWLMNYGHVETNSTSCGVYPFFGCEIK